ncbi:hypothetical protein P12x_003763 [Tundrisphaera lichenicola]|uniref:hypothetical protein n=1 Tax=Tundrisphaera lichenicola TaxID=2029860 RepID=UPI003EBF2CCF
MIDSIAILAYLGPETMLPMTSIVAGVVGVIMMFGRNFFRILRNAFQLVTGRAKNPARVSHHPRKIGTGPVGGIIRDDAVNPAAADNKSVHL